MPKIREIKDDMQIIEIKPDTRLASDISEKMNAKEIEQSIMGLVKQQHHHADGTVVNLQVVHTEEEEFQRRAARDQMKNAPKNLDSLVQENLPQKERQAEEDEQRRKSAVHQGQWSSNYQSRDAGGSGGGKGFDVQCNCGQEFHFGGAQAQQIQTTAEKMDAQKMKYASGGGGGGDTRQQYSGGGGMKQSYDAGSDDGGRSDYRR